MTSTAMMKVHQAKLISTGNGRAPGFEMVNVSVVVPPVDAGVNDFEKEGDTTLILTPAPEKSAL
jgi:hypothetical protein